MTQSLAEQLYEELVRRGKPKQPRSPRTAKSTTLLTRTWGEDTPASEHYICVVYDETTGRLYLIGGLGTTEKLITKLQGYKKPHIIHQFEGKLKSHPKLPYKVISRNGRTRLGTRMNLDLKWKEVIVIPGTGDFHFMIHNHYGRQDRVGGGT